MNENNPSPSLIPAYPFYLGIQTSRSSVDHREPARRRDVSVVGALPPVLPTFLFYIRRIELVLCTGQDEPHFVTRYCGRRRYLPGRGASSAAARRCVSRTVQLLLSQVKRRIQSKVMSDSSIHLYPPTCVDALNPTEFNFTACEIDFPAASFTSLTPCSKGLTWTCPLISFACY